MDPMVRVAVLVPKSMFWPEGSRIIGGAVAPGLMLAAPDPLTVIPVLNVTLFPF
jgi:hypothetical protein